jgi:oligopeptide transport system substrate-binding protein
VETAKKLLAAAGYPEGRGFPKLELLYNTSEAHRTIAEAVQQMWKQHLNIDIRLVNQEWKVYLDSMKRMDYTLARSAWIGDYNDPNTFLDMWVTGGGNNRTGWSNPEYDRWIAAAAAAADQKSRFEAFQQAEAVLLREMPIIPIYFYVHSMLIRPSVRGWHPTLLDHHPYKYVWLEP